MHTKFEPWELSVHGYILEVAISSNYLRKLGIMWRQAEYCDFGYICIGYAVELCGEYVNVWV
jgi:hypothetical protein